ncbi:MAG: WG repeat-containing protein [Bacteroidetes bacterium]|nr:WG repeat-containing protein [Bacteroidota bacterium]
MIFLSFSEGLAVVEKEGKYGFFDKAGKLVIPIIYDDAQDFSDGLFS